MTSLWESFTNFTLVSEYTILDLDPNYNEKKHEIRIFCIFIALISNVYLLGFMTFKILKKQKQFNVLFGGAIISILCSTISTLYNLMYRFIIRQNQCPISDIIDEFIFAFARSVLLLFYVTLISKVFETTNQSINDTFKKCLIGFIIIVHMILLPCIYISQQEGTAIPTPSYGIYCRNEFKTKIAQRALLLYHIVDCVITIILGGLFIYKLRGLMTDFFEPDDEQDSEENIRERHVMNKLLTLSKKRLVLMLISIISSWIILFGGKMDTNSETIFRWILPLDYVINGWCIFLLFDWGELFQCLCLKDADVGVNKDVEKAIQNADK
eukprot:431071_1